MSEMSVKILFYINVKKKKILCELSSFCIVLILSGSINTCRLGWTYLKPDSKQIGFQYYKLPVSLISQ